MDQNDFEDCYRLNWWEKLKHGTAVYGVFWDSTKENGLGDISVKEIDILKLFWEPGITDIQDSRNLFICELVDTDLLDEQYPEHKDKMKAGGNIEIPKYLYSDDVDITDKSMVVDWYYKLHDPSGRTVLHYCKFCNDEVLYASENDPQYAARGFYDHGKYPIVLDVLYPEKGTPVGFGYVAVCKDPQLYIDELSSNLLQSSMMGSKKRFFVSSSTNINEEDFANWNKDLVRVEGELNDMRIMENPAVPEAVKIQIMIDRSRDDVPAVRIPAEIGELPAEPAEPTKVLAMPFNGDCASVYYGYEESRTTSEWNSLKSNFGKNDKKASDYELCVALRYLGVLFHSEFSNADGLHDEQAAHGRPHRYAQSDYCVARRHGKPRNVHVHRVPRTGERHFPYRGNASERQY